MNQRTILTIRTVSDTAGALLLLGVAGHALSELAFGPIDVPRAAVVPVFGLLAALFSLSPLMTLFMMTRRRYRDELNCDADPETFRRAAVIGLVILAPLFALMSFYGDRLSIDPARMGMLGMALLFIPAYLMSCRQRLRALRRG
jgi:hypothetical protein